MSFDTPPKSEPTREPTPRELRSASSRFGLSFVAVSRRRVNSVNSLAKVGVYEKLLESFKTNK